MRPFQVQGVAVQISPGTQLIVTQQQLAARKPQVKRIKPVGGDGVMVEAISMLTFKSGEIIGLSEPPKQALQHLVDIHAAERARRDAEHRAAQGDRDAREAADKAAKDAADKAAKDAADKKSGR